VPRSSLLLPMPSLPALAVALVLRSPPLPLSLERCLPWS